MAHCIAKFREKAITLSLYPICVCVCVCVCACVHVRLHVFNWEQPLYHVLLNQKLVLLFMFLVMSIFCYAGRFPLWWEDTSWLSSNGSGDRCCISRKWFSSSQAGQYRHLGGSENWNWYTISRKAQRREDRVLCRLVWAVIILFLYVTFPRHVGGDWPSCWLLDLFGYFKQMLSWYPQNRQQSLRSTPFISRKHPNLWPLMADNLCNVNPFFK